MRCAIMQPTYFPWAGYFNLMSQVDYFVFLDDVQFDKRSWQQRNRILLEGKDRFISVPVKAGGQEQIIHEVMIDDSQPWRNKQQMTIRHAYARHPYKNEVWNLIDTIGDVSYKFLADLNIRLITDISEKLALSCSFIRASTLNIGGKRSKHLLNICNYLKCDEYLSPLGSAAYLSEEGLFDNNSVKLMFQDYTPLSYPQRGNEVFISHLSILDAVANLGWSKTVEYVLRGRVNQ